jgi:hypothetical protein
MTLTPYQHEVLSAFAASRTPRSRHDVFGHLSTAQAGQRLDNAIQWLRDANLLVALPTAEVADKHGGTCFLVTPKGRMVLGLPATPAVPVAAGQVKSVVSRNGKPARRAS